MPEHNVKTPKFDTIDAQVHLSLELNQDALLASMDSLGIKGVIVDEFWHFNERGHGMPCTALPDGSSRPISPLAEAAAMQWPERFCYLQRINRNDPMIENVLALLGSNPACKAIRLMLVNSAERKAFADGGYDQILRLAEQHDLTVCIFVVDTAAMAKVARNFPNIRFVLDHCGWARSPEHWTDILALSALSNVAMKWGHTAKAFQQQLRTNAQAEAVELQRAIDAFSVERMMWVGDITHDESGRSWSELLELVRASSQLSDSDKEWILGRAARRWFCW